MLTPKLDCVVIETTTACTRTCTWCTHHYYDIKPNFMSEELFLKIIAELREIDFSGRLSFFFLGEPLLDERLSRWINIGKKACPRSFTFITSNGDLLTYDRIIELLDTGLDAIKVNTYDDNTFIRVNEIIRKLPAALSKHILHLDYSKKTDWTSRGGTVPVSLQRNDKENKKMVCPRPFMQLNIAHNGMVPQCCSDALNRHIMGDANTQSLSRIWSGDQFMKVRNSLIGKGELNNLCKICDLEGTYERVEDLRKLYGNVATPKRSGIVTTPRRRARWALRHTFKTHYTILRREGLRKYILYSYSYRKGQILNWLKKRAE